MPGRPDAATLSPGGRSFNTLGKRKATTMGGANTQYTAELKERQIAFLKEMAAKHNLPDESKALRCLLDYAIEQAGTQDDIFKKIHCLGC